MKHTIILGIAFLMALSACSSGDNDDDVSNVDPAVSFHVSAQSWEPARTVEIALADLDNDGDLDAVFSNMGLNPSTVWLNDGTGSFEDSGLQLNDLGHGVGVGDFDGDDDLDLFITSATYTEDEIVYQRSSMVYLNDGDVSFSNSSQNLNDLELSGNGLFLLDFESDGDLDAIVVYYQHPDRLYLNDGNGVFTLSEYTPPENAHWTDLNNDDSQDAFICDDGTAFRVQVNNGAGSMSEIWSMTDTSGALCVPVFGDLDNDEDTDVVVFAMTSDKDLPTRVLLNDGSGSFSDMDQALPSTNMGAVGLGDFNDDGSLDIVITNPNNDAVLMLNNGSGIFVDSEVRIETGEAFLTPAVGDLNGDNIPDLFFPNFFNGGNILLFTETTH